MRENIDDNTELEWQFKFPPEVQAERQRVLEAYDRAMSEGTLEAIKEAGALGWDWVARYPKDYVVWDAGEPLSMLADAIEATSPKAETVNAETADGQALSLSR